MMGLPTQERNSAPRRQQRGGDSKPNRAEGGKVVVPQRPAATDGRKDAVVERRHCHGEKSSAMASFAAAHKRKPRTPNVDGNAKRTVLLQAETSVVKRRKTMAAIRRHNKPNRALHFPAASTPHTNNTAAVFAQPLVDFAADYAIAAKTPTKSLTAVLDDLSTKKHSPHNYDPLKGFSFCNADSWLGRHIVVPGPQRREDSKQWMPASHNHRQRHRDSSVAHHQSTTNPRQQQAPSSCLFLGDDVSSLCESMSSSGSSSSSSLSTSILEEAGDGSMMSLGSDDTTVVASTTCTQSFLGQDNHHHFHTPNNSTRIPTHWSKSSSFWDTPNKDYPSKDDDDSATQEQTSDSSVRTQPLLLTHTSLSSGTTPISSPATSNTATSGSSFGATTNTATTTTPS